MTVGVYFDIDGTLVSRTTDDDEFIPTADSFDLTLDEDAVKIHDQLVEQYFRRNISDGYCRATEVWCEQYGFDLDSAAFTQQLKAEKIETTRRASDLTLLSTLAENEDVQLGILTNGAGDIQREKLARHSLTDFFDPLLISGEQATMKPEDEMFQLAANALPADQHVYVADHLASDIVPAQENGFVGVLIDEESSPVVDLTLPSVAALSSETLTSLL